MTHTLPCTITGQRRRSQNSCINDVEEALQACLLCLVMNVGVIYLAIGTQRNVSVCINVIPRYSENFPSSRNSHNGRHFYSVANLF